MKHLMLTLVLIPLSIFGVLAQNSLQRSVYFDKNKEIIKPQSETTLVEVMDFLAKNPTFQIQLTGSTDADGNDEDNRLLSERRVQAVRQFLEKKGISANKITTEAFGETQPIADNATENGKKQNRRVDIKISLVQRNPTVSAVQSTPSVSTAQKTPTNLKIAKTNNIFALYRELATTIQVFKIQTSKDTVIRGTKGTVITIPKNAFAGAPNGAIVDFKLKEAYAFSDMICDNLNTMMGGIALQTGGMIYTEANYNGQQLSLKSDLNVQFNSKESQLKGMQLYAGQRNMKQNGRMNWESLKPAQDDDFNPIASDIFSDSTTIFARESGAFEPYLILNQKTRKPMTLKELCDTTGCSPLTLRTNRKDSFTVRPSMSNTCGAMAMYVQAHPLFQNKPLSKIHRAAFNDAYLIYNVNEYDVLRKQNGRSWDSLMSERMKVVFFNESSYFLARRKREDSLKIVYQEMERLQDSFNIEYEKKMNRKISTNPAFALNYLGWVNCDRLVGYSDRQIATIQVNLILTESCDIKVISKKGKQVIAANRYKNGVSEFSAIMNEDLVLVAMKVENDVSYLAIMNMRGENTTLTPNFKALTATEIKEKLKVLDN